MARRARASCCACRSGIEAGNAGAKLKQALQDCASQMQAYGTVLALNKNPQTLPRWPRPRK